MRQNRARRHSHSFRPLHDVSGFKVVPPTLPQKEPGETPEGWWSISLPFSTSLIPPVPVLPHFCKPGPAVSGSMWRRCTLSHALNGEGGGDGWIEWSEFGASGVIRPRAVLRRRWRHQQTEKRRAQEEIRDKWKRDWLLGTKWARVRYTWR